MSFVLRELVSRIWKAEILNILSLNYTVGLKACEGVILTNNS